MLRFLGDAILVWQRISALQSIRRVAATVETLALAVWVGAMSAFAFIFAPLAFRLVTDGDLFGRLAEATILGITHLGMVCLVAAALTLDLGSRRGPLRTSRTVCYLLMYLASSIEATQIIPGMHGILVRAHGDVTRLALTDPLRQAFDAQHHLSSMVYGVALIAGYAALILRANDAFGSAQAAGSALPRERKIGLGE